MPGCLRSRAASTRACRAKTVLPVPGPPITRLVRFRGSPPRLISSNPWMPVATLDRTRGVTFSFAVTPAPEAMRPEPAPHPPSFCAVALIRANSAGSRVAGDQGAKLAPGLETLELDVISDQPNSAHAA